MRRHMTAALLCALAVSTSSVLAADNTLTEEEKSAGWKLLFN